MLPGGAFAALSRLLQLLAHCRLARHWFRRLFSMPLKRHSRFISTRLRNNFANNESIDRLLAAAGNAIPAFPSMRVVGFDETPEREHGGKQWRKCRLRDRRGKIRNHIALTFGERARCDQIFGLERVREPREAPDHRNNRTDRGGKRAQNAATQNQRWNSWPMERRASRSGALSSASVRRRIGSSKGSRLRWKV